jgi:Domain of unknown function (DUF4145)
MSSEFAKSAFVASKTIQNEVNQLWLPPSESIRHKGEKVIPISYVRKARGYIKTVVYQINGTYEYAAYDACAVMVRRLIETLIIEAFENNGISDKIKTSNGDFPYLSDLITFTLDEKKWNLGRNTKQALTKLKKIGDLAAHTRRFNAHRDDIDKIIDDLRISVQELIHIAELQQRP